MKKALISLVFISFTLINYSQDIAEIYLDKDFNKSDKEKGVIVRTTIYKDNHYFVTEKFINGKLINYGEFISINPWIEDGLSIHYDEFGEIYSKGRYLNGLISGQWIYFNKNKPSIADYSLVENFYKNIKDSCYKLDAINYDGKSTQKVNQIKSNLKSFINNNLKLPARASEDSENDTVIANITIDSNGLISCPILTNCSNNDIAIESYRVLLLYKSDTIIESPINISIPIIFSIKNAGIDELAYVVFEKNATCDGRSIKEFQSYIQNNLKYSYEALKSGIQGRVIVKFSVNTSCEVVNQKLIRSVHPNLDDEVMRLICNSTKWTSASNNDKKYVQQIIFPIDFKVKNAANRKNIPIL